MAGVAAPRRRRHQCASGLGVVKSVALDVGDGGDGGDGGERSVRRVSAHVRGGSEEDAVGPVLFLRPAGTLGGARGGGGGGARTTCDGEEVPRLAWRGELLATAGVGG